MAGIPDWYELAVPCPFNTTGLGANDWLKSPATSISHFAIAVLSVVCTVLVVFKCSSISALWKRTFPLAITNVHWILFFFLTAVQSALHCAVYVEHPDKPGLLHVNFVAGTLLRSLQVLLVALAFQHERVYRRLTIAKDNKSFRQSTCFERCHVVNALSTCLFLVQVVLVVLVETKFPDSDLLWAIQSVLIAQRLVVLCLVFSILRRHGEEDCPRPAAMACVFAAMLFTSPSDISVYFLVAYQSNMCLLYFGTLYDLFLITDAIGITLLLIYVRLEYVRLLPVCRYSLISSIQGQLNFHPH